MAHVLYGLRCTDEAMSSHLLNEFRLGGEDHLMEGYVCGFTNPPLHSLCKNVTRLRGLIPGVDQKYAKRTYALVVGDTDSDAGMLDGWKGKCLLKVGLEAEEVTF
ncbi:hypothetical protein ANCDUO_12359 [Ancylostoma duodenale]|uniref:Uncharacterized protein n=1 Tax=Ancylostoma duodenale TaxID=51022 RepID=A0A0C2GK57_9BILA|nr:hypothetical protein ANCDUO_12359 [Ancylostoma duodenale]